MKQDNNIQILLCGTQYGQVYLPAIDELNGFDVAAILARGSDRSIRLVEQRGINLIRHPSQLDDRIDLACVAIGGTTGVDIALDLLEMRIPVLIEHPVSDEDIGKLLHTASGNGTQCHINSHFPGLYPVSRFISLSKKLNSVSRAKVINITCNSRTLFSMLDILLRCFGPHEIDRLQSHSIGDEKLYVQSSFTIDDIPCTLSYQKWRGQNDDSTDSPLGHDITVTYPEGVLRLSGSYGPCQWFPLVANTLPPHMPIYSQSDDSDGRPSSHDVVHWRLLANQESIVNLYETHINPHYTDDYQSHEWLTHLCTTWSRLHQMLGVITVDTAYKGNSKSFYNVETLLDS